MIFGLKSARHAGVCCKTVRVMRILALDHGTKRIGVAVSDEMKMIAQPLEYIPAEPFADFLARLKEIARAKRRWSSILVGLPRNMDGSYGPAAQKVQEFVAALKDAITVPDQDLGRAADLGAGQPDSDPGQRPPRQAQGEGGQDGGGDPAAELSGWDLI